MNLRRRQDLCLDAIEHSFSMANIAYARIVRFCQDDLPEGAGGKEDELVLDAWSFVDVLKRLRSILEHTPGLKAGTALTEFLQASASVVNFRHHHQHMEEKTAQVAPSGRPIWGAFSWAVVEPDKNHFRIGVYLPGRAAKTEGVTAVNPAGREFRANVDHFQVTVGDTTLKISDMYYLLRAFQERFTAALRVAQPRFTSSGEEFLGIYLDHPQGAITGSGSLSPQ